MIEQQSINGKSVWLKVDPYHVQRSSRDTIPTEYFTATYYFREPASDNAGGQLVNDENGELKLFESPVAALSFARKRLEEII
jgi:hypothetical protein